MTEVIRGSFDSLHGLYLSGRELTVDAFPQQVDEAHDCIEWSPQLVRDVREELALHPIYAQ